MSSEYPVLTPRTCTFDPTLPNARILTSFFFFDSFAEQREERKAKIIRQTQMDGLKASLVTTAAVFALHYGAKKYWPRWKRFPLSPRIFWLSSAVVATYVVCLPSFTDIFL